MEIERVREREIINWGHGTIERALPIGCKNVFILSSDVKLINGLPTLSEK